MKRIAVIRIRGSKGVRREIKDTMSFLRLNNKNHCVIIDNKPTHVGMLRKIKDYVTWGEVDEKTFRELLLKDKELKQYLAKFTKKQAEILKNPENYTGISAKKVESICGFWKQELRL